MYKCKCLKVVDGDTLHVAIEYPPNQFTKVVVRLLGVNTPELHAKDQETRDKAEAAKAFTANLFPVGAIGTANFIDKDCFGRSLGTIQTTEGADICQALLEAGHAVPFQCSKAVAERALANK